MPFVLIGLFLCVTLRSFWSGQSTFLLPLSAVYCARTGNASTSTARCPFCATHWVQRLFAVFVDPLLVRPVVILDETLGLFSRDFLSQTDRRWPYDRQQNLDV